MTKSNLNKKYTVILETIEKYPEQLQQAWGEINRMTLPKEFKHIENVVVCGMGGSALGARIVKSLIYSEAGVPIEIVNNYSVPNYVDNKTLVVTSSYSGDTEEILESLHIAIQKKANIFGITTGGKMVEVLKEHEISRYIYDPKNNPSKQPRMAIGYSAGSILALLSKMKIIHYRDEDIKEVVSNMKKTIKEYGEDVPEKENLTKRLSTRLKNRAPILVASEHLLGTAHTIKNQFNESAKTFSALFEIPELNHHLMEGLTNPRRIQEVFYFIFFNSKLYKERVQKRYPLTMEVVTKQGLKFSEFNPRSTKKIEQVFETLVFGSYIGYYLAKDYGINPTTIPWVDYFKRKLLLRK